MAFILVIAALSMDVRFIQKTLSKINYYLKRNYNAYKSHSKKRCFINKLTL